MATIKPIAGSSIHQIQSGQVIVDLCSVVKELVENSLDAGATAIDVRFVNQGLDLIEIQDNGWGITSENYETIALKHYTSKLSSYDDLSSLSTFGFRGEALSSLCALSRFHILTATEKEAPKGKRLDFETSGQLKNASVAALPRGTCVAVAGLFYNLPVRRRELEKNIKREYGKVLSVLNAYACISTRTRFSVSNQMLKGKKTIVFSTKSNATTKENIANVYGAKTLLGLIPLDLELELRPTISQLGRSSSLATPTTSQQVKLLGHVSRPVFGEGRQAPDRQMFFVNSRPCDLPQIAKAFNEVYKSYNITQSPFIFADMKMDTNAYDVNVSPDKRTILLHDQSLLLETLKESLNELFQNQEQTVPQSQLYSKQLPSFRPVAIDNRLPLGIDMTSDVQKGGSPQDDPLSDLPQVTQDATIPLSSDSTMPSENNAPNDLIYRFAGRNLQDRKDGDAKDTREGTGLSKIDLNSAKESTLFSPIQNFSAPVTGQEARLGSGIETPDASGEDKVVHAGEKNDRARAGNMELNLPFSSSSVEEMASESVDLKARTELTESPPTKRRRVESLRQANVSKLGVPASYRFAQHVRELAAPGTEIEESSGNTGNEIEENQLDDKLASDEASESQPSDEFQATTGDAQSQESDGSDPEYIDEEERQKRDEARIGDMVRRAEESAAHPSAKQKKRAETLLNRPSEKDGTVSIVARLSTSVRTITASLENTKRLYNIATHISGQSVRQDDPLPSRMTAEERLSLTIAKSDFSKMRVVGQFNLGFILTTRRPEASLRNGKTSEDLFIIDQHASDEIFNFSRLSLTTSLTPQPLVRPHPLELTAVEEETVLHNTDTLEKNGFNITTDESGNLPVGQRCHLLTLPTSRETVFDMRDLEELIALLGEPDSSSNSATVTRPSKVRKMLAMRACRSSVMVGKPLTKPGMTKLVRHMGTIDRPWNCPHGRPTMRHLASLSEWNSWNEGDGLVDEYEYVRQQPNWSDYIQRAWEEGLTGRKHSPSVADDNYVLDEDAINAS